MRDLRTSVMLAAGLAAGVLAGCDQPETEPSPVPSTAMVADAAPVPAAPAIERVKFSYQPIGPDATTAGLLTVMLPPGNEGPGRTYTFAAGEVVEAELSGWADITQPIGTASMAAALGVSEEALKNNGSPSTYLLRIISDNAPAGVTKICGDVAPTHIVQRQLDTAADKTVTLVFTTAPPGDKAAVACKKLVYTAG